jgi:hypothetical protein
MKTEWDYTNMAAAYMGRPPYSALFTDIEEISAPFLHREHVGKVICLWRSHYSLYRYAGAGFGEVIAAIDQYIHSLGREYLEIPYTTKSWLARKKD